jgi:hypothetical protein
MCEHLLSTRHLPCGLDDCVARLSEKEPECSRGARLCQVIDFGPSPLVDLPRFAQWDMLHW